MVEFISFTLTFQTIISILVVYIGLSQIPSHPRKLVSFFGNEGFTGFI